MNSDLNGVPLREAARRLNKSVDAVRMQLRRKSLQGYQVDGRWFVVLPAQVNATAERDHEQGEQSDQTALVQQLQTENARLWQEIEARRQAEQELRLIIARLTERLPELTGGPETRLEPAEASQQDVEASSTPTAATSRPWWQVWRR